ncbi:hypothetical protein EDEG_01405 [Edhazardia aedis USNM 41457]|uniref:Uncharacterized protein n=1 Tax=Edhazardia aedis (strain USNM 41457) TaxID=1003232 RepID=J9D9Z6_EDHAE|nr:hypothetical protein EDEG_01405 [Edhazardia aedis USNM 41457]|eukprot:EJW04339.1 hypothetical protein EDEG_01405 [Edhazardia aedis USNM 41457]
MSEKMGTRDFILIIFISTLVVISLLYTFLFDKKGKKTRNDYYAEIYLLFFENTTNAAEKKEKFKKLHDQLEIYHLSLIRKFSHESLIQNNDYLDVKDAYVALKHNMWVFFLDEVYRDMCYLFGCYFASRFFAKISECALIPKKLAADTQNKINTIKLTSQNLYFYTRIVLLLKEIFEMAIAQYPNIFYSEKSEIENSINNEFIYLNKFNTDFLSIRYSVQSYAINEMLEIFNKNVDHKMQDTVNWYFSHIENAKLNNKPVY